MRTGAASGAESLHLFPQKLKTTGNRHSRPKLAHVNAYLQIEKARCEQLSVDIAIPDALKQASLPVFSLQPIVENAIKHGTSQIFEQENYASARRRPLVI